MKRILLTISSALMLGVMTNVAVAWFHAWMFATDRVVPAVWEHHGHNGLEVKTASGQLHLGAPSWFLSYVMDDLDKAEFGDLIPAVSRFHVYQPSNDGPHYSEHYFGWPMLSSHYVLEHRFPCGAAFDRAEFIWDGAGDGFLQVSEGTQIDLPLLLPINPNWPGFLGNSLLYAVAILVLVFGGTNTRRLIRNSLRSRRGLCRRCAYDLRGTIHRLCPECGHATGFTADAVH